MGILQAHTDAIGCVVLSDRKCTYVHASVVPGLPYSTDDHENSDDCLYVATESGLGTRLCTYLYNMYL